MSNKIIKTDEKEQEKQTKQSKKQHPEPKRISNKQPFRWQPVAAGIGIFLVVVICILVGYDQLHRKLILTVNDNKIYLDQMAYYIYEEESQIPMYDSLYQQFYGSNYLDFENEDGTINRDVVSDQIINKVTQNQILYEEAMKNGFTVTEEDKKSAQEKTEEAVKNMSKKQTLMTGLSKEAVYNVIEQQVFTERYRKSVIEGLKLDYDNITKNISKKDYREYDIQYYHIATTDDSGKEVSAEQKTAAKNHIQEIAEKAKTESDFTKLVDTKSESETATFEKEGKFTEKDGFLDKKNDAVIKKMKNNEVSGVIEAKDGYYVIKMIDNNSTASYEEAVKNAKTEAETDAFNKEYEKMQENYDVDVNYDEWDSITIGRFSI